jgi:hypothetical protein
MDERSRLVSDADREQTIAVLREHLLVGRLTLEEFSERVGAAYWARTSGDLELVAGRLPQPVAVPSHSRRRPLRFTGALFGHVVRRGRIRLRRSTTAFSAFADIDLDLREAEIESADTRVRVLAMFGNVDVYVPEGIDVDVGGLTIVGHRREWGRDVGHPDAPAVRIRTIGLFATVDVWRVPNEIRGGYSEIIAQLEGEQAQLPPAIE